MFEEHYRWIIILQRIYHVYCTLRNFPFIKNFYRIRLKFLNSQVPFLPHFMGFLAKDFFHSMKCFQRKTTKTDFILEFLGNKFLVELNFGNGG